MIHILSKQETQKILASLQEQFGIKEIPGILLKIGQERIFLYQGFLNEKELKELEKTVFIERLGVYIAKMHGGEVRLSIEGTHIFKDQITKNTFELDEKQVDEWMKGRELNVALGKKEFLIMTHKGDFLGTGKVSENKITNFIPKNRRLREKVNL